MRTLIALLLAAFAVATMAKQQAVGARGQLMCGDKPLANAEVKLWELDTWPDPDDLLANVKTDAQGRFQIQGHENEVTTIKPVIKIYHRCNNKGLFNLPGVCKRKMVYEIPSNYITGGKAPSRYYDLGIMNMEAKQKGEGTECI